MKQRVDSDRDTGTFHFEQILASFYLIYAVRLNAVHPIVTSQLRVPLCMDETCVSPSDIGALLRWPARVSSLMQYFAISNLDVGSTPGPCPRPLCFSIVEA